MLPRLLRVRAGVLTRLLLESRGGNVGRSLMLRRTMIAAPKAGDPPLMSRRADRELPELPTDGMKWVKTVPIFLVILISSALAIFNYQKSSSPVVSSTLYALRTSPRAREYLGSEIYFANKMPWIWGEMNQLHGRIDIQFEVMGTSRAGTMRFTSSRRTRQGMFETTEWSLETYDMEDDGKGGVRRRKIDLLDGADPFKAIEMGEEEKVVGRGSYAPNISS
ncbi:cytochrome oxidase complex assembly protein 1-domain-containing protein [Amylocarpus encephaloides]|uniref:Cytochrome oxidase complex assembly protein 1-domain-containing protein n=1 Tax=Amylocarpus encephaloides TaxID=45428 RepID=A0A9P8C703_9HELO|nr:cytochrome oxidase complex assembly protein 1-domain-containing protein [Amylocarpus encephaloides]